jgi:thioredoxin reductase (NADPH)
MPGKPRKKEKDPWLIPKDSREQLKEQFKVLKERVILEIFSKKGENEPYNELAIRFATDLSTLTDKIGLRQNKIGDARAKKYDVTRSPTVLINPEQYHIRYSGAPAGEEGVSFLQAIMLVSLRESGFSKTSKEMLSQLKEKRHVQIYITPDCPYCPGQVINAFKAAIERPHQISSECVDSTQNLDLAKKYNVGSVPQTVINEKTISLGFEPEERFISELISLQPAEVEIPPVSQEMIEADLIIIGAGPAGLTAGIYAKRSGLNTIILEKANVGGQVSITPVVENYPGFQNIPGKKLMAMIAAQARNYADIREGEEVREIKVGKRIEAITTRAHYAAKALLLATGAHYKKLDVPGEAKFYGHGVSYCATCDGYLFKDKKVVVVGGGNTALTDALHLKNLGASVTIVHRREEFRADKHLQESVNREGIMVLWNSAVEEILGDDKLTAIKLKNTKNDKIQEIETDGVFIAVGEQPNNQLAMQIGLILDESGFIKSDRSGRTSIPRIYAAGDVTVGLRQIVTAVGEGAAAAQTVFEDISHPYWLHKTN